MCVSMTAPWHHEETTDQQWRKGCCYSCFMLEPLTYARTETLTHTHRHRLISVHILTWVRVTSQTTETTTTHHTHVYIRVEHGCELWTLKHTHTHIDMYYTCKCVNNGLHRIFMGAACAEHKKYCTADEHIWANKVFTNEQRTNDNHCASVRVCL